MAEHRDAVTRAAGGRERSPHGRSAAAARTARLALLLQRARLRAALQYRTDLLLQAAMGVAYQCSGFAFVWIVLQTFPSLAGWSLAQVAFLYALRLLSHAFWLLPFNPLVIMDQMVREGEFDRYLVRPLNPLIQVITTRAMRMGAFGDLAAGTALFVVASRAARVDWSAAAVVFCVLAVLGGALIESAAQLALAALTFRWLETARVRGLVEDVFNGFGSYPLKIFGGATEWLLTFVIPLAFVAYLPASLLLGPSVQDGLRVSAWVAWLGPAIGLALFVAAYAFWSSQLRHYQSAGH